MARFCDPSRLWPLSCRRSSCRVLAGLAVAAAFCLFNFSSLEAQELEPRAYAAIPSGVHFIAFGWARSTGNVVMDPALPIEGLEADLNLLYLGYTRTLSVAGNSAKFKVVAPWASGDWEGSVEGEDSLSQRRDSGAGDLRLSFHVNFLGAPSLDRKEFQEFKQRWVVGTGITILAPTGDYDPDRLLNLGSNRWTLRPEIGFSRAFEKCSFDGAASIWFFTDNSDFLGGNIAAQEALYVLKGHAVYSFRPGFWTSLGVGWGNGGQSSVNGVPRETLQSNWRFAWTLAYPLTPAQGVILGLGSAVTRRAGGDFDTLTIAYQYSWGGKS